MPTATDTIEALATQEYKYGLVTEVETESVPKGLNEAGFRRVTAVREARAHETQQSRHGSKQGETVTWLRT